LTVTRMPASLFWSPGKLNHQRRPIVAIARRADVKSRHRAMGIVR
jgi:hypothetical protein